MGKTLAEKILSSKSGVDAKAGDIIIAPLDLVFAHDVSAPLAIRRFREGGLGSLANPKATVIFIDHCIPSPRPELSNDQIFVRAFAREQGCILYQMNDGICHQLVVEDWASPGDVICGGDSHTVTAGALGAFASGMGSTDIAVAMGLGKTWLRVPETILIKLSGQFSPGVYAKDLALHVIGLLGADGATYKSLEFGGDTLETMAMSHRCTVANMSVEVGAKVGLFPADAITKDYLEVQGRGDRYQPLSPDPDAVYERIIEVDASKLVPMVAKPHLVDNVAPVSEVAGTKIDQVFIGSCTNARLDDLAIVASILDGNKCHPQTRLIIAPASRTVYLEALKKGYIEIFINAGAVLVNPGCSVCGGIHQGVLGDGEVCLATTNRNFKGRMANPEAFVYLASPATAATSAITGEITSPK
ncbi:3-isopropylmalate dehydratase large subunit [Chloroflexota bacterium]